MQTVVARYFEIGEGQEKRSVRGTKRSVRGTKRSVRGTKFCWKTE